MKYCSPLLSLLLMVFLSSCGTLNRSTTSDARIAELTTENQQIKEEYAQLRIRVEELDEALRTTGFLEPQVIVEHVTFAESGETLQRVLDRGVLHCGVNINAPGLGYLDAEAEQFSGFDIDFCRAVAAALFGVNGADQIEPLALTNRSRFAALQAGDIDVLIRNTTWTLSRDATLDLDFAEPTLYDGVGMLVHGDSGITSLQELANQTVCVLAEGTAEAAVTSFYDFLDETVEVDLYPDSDSARTAYESGDCAGLANDRTSLLGQRVLMAEPDSHIILSEEMSREPLAPVVRHNDSNWLDIVTWVVQCTLNAEYLGVNQRNVEKSRSSDDLRIQRLLGEVDDLGKGLGLSNNFCYQIVAQVGNYADIYNRNLGPGTPYNLPRRLNALYNDGGLLYPLPFQ